MRTQTLIVTRRCNQACGFCTRVRPGAPASTDPPLGALVEQVKAATAAGASAIVLSGGEPLLRSDLFALVRAARACGAKDVVLETNATLIDGAKARALRTLGVGAVRVSIVTLDEKRHPGLVGAPTLPDGPDRILGGIRACLEAGLEVSVRLPIARGLPTAAARIEALGRELPAVDRFELSAALPGEATLEPSQALARSALTDELAAAYQAAARRKVEVTLAAEQPIPPCTVDAGARGASSPPSSAPTPESPRAPAPAASRARSPPAAPHAPSSSWPPAATRPPVPSTMSPATCTPAGTPAPACASSAIATSRASSTSTTSSASTSAARPAASASSTAATRCAPSASSPTWTRSSRPRRCARRSGRAPSAARTA
jgi:pyruvate-formate lyase-activating enzyme